MLKKFFVREAVGICLCFWVCLWLGWCFGFCFGWFVVRVNVVTGARECWFG